MADSLTQRWPFRVPADGERPSPEVWIPQLREQGKDYFAPGVPREPGAWRIPLSEYKAEVETQVIAWTGYANWLYNLRGDSAVPIPTLSFQLKGKTAGMVRYHRRGPDPIVRDLRINIDLLERFPQRIIGETVPHEVAHVVARHLHKDRTFRPHGKEWQSVMRDLGQNPRRCHSMPTYRASARRVWRPMWWLYFDGFGNHLAEQDVVQSIQDHGGKDIVFECDVHLLDPEPTWRCFIQ